MANGDMTEDDENKEYSESLLSRIREAAKRAASFFNALRTECGFKYTVTHDVEKYPAALLYGTWSAVLGSHLLGALGSWEGKDKAWVRRKIEAHKQTDGAFLAIGLREQRNAKSLEYLTLHCTNYSHGALIALDENYDFETPYLHRFLDADTLAYWLDGRSFLRPWEEGNNIVNVASYLALCYERGVPNADSRLMQLLEWHRRYQNPETGGFDSFTSPTVNQRLQSLAGAVHNFHLHLYLGEELRYEQQIAAALPLYLLQGRLTACLSIDFVELAIRTINYSSNPQLLAWALLSHAEALLDSQRDDGGWLEAADDSTLTTGAGFRDTAPSSCSYATWFRLCSLGMIAIVLLGDNPANWSFRKTLGMGYAPDYWPRSPSGIEIAPISIARKARYLLMALPHKTKMTMIDIGKKLIR